MHVRSSSPGSTEDFKDLGLTRLTMRNCDVFGNVASRIYTQGHIMEVLDSAASGQTSVVESGAITLAGYTVAIIEESALMSNSAMYGGAVAVKEQVHLTLRNVTMESNYAACGGALATSSVEPVNMQGLVVFSKNQGANGGAFCVLAGGNGANARECMEQLGTYPFMILSDLDASVVFEFNKADWGGGALFAKCQNPGEATMVCMCVCMYGADLCVYALSGCIFSAVLCGIYCHVLVSRLPLSVCFCLGVRACTSIYMCVRVGHVHVHYDVCTGVHTASPKE